MGKKSIVLVLILLSVFVSASPTVRAYPFEDPAPGYYETSEYMVGDMAVEVVFVETEYWYDTEEKAPNYWDETSKEQAWAAARYAFEWFENEAEKSGVPLSFHLREWGVFRLQETDPYEDNDWGLSEVQEGVGNFNDYANSLRENLDADWVVVLLLYKVGSDWPLPSGTAGGVYATALHHPPLYPDNPDEVQRKVVRTAGIIAHEVAHNFRALHEFSTSVRERAGYFDEYQEPTTGPSLMGSWSTDEDGWKHLTDGTKRIIGWVFDNEGNLKVLDTLPTVKITSALPVELGSTLPDFTDNQMLEAEGYAVDVPYPTSNPIMRDISINKITEVQHRLQGPGADSEWTWASPADIGYGTVDYGEEPYFFFRITSTLDEYGEYTLDIMAGNGIASKVESFTVTYTDVVIENVYADKEKVEVGGHVHIRVKGVWAHDNSPVTDGYAVIGGKKAYFDDNGWAEATAWKNSEGTETLGVESVSVWGITEPQLEASAVSITWEKVATPVSDENNVFIFLGIVATAILLVLTALKTSRGFKFLKSIRQKLAGP